MAGATDGFVPSYRESPPVPPLAGAVRTVWVQCAGPLPYPQRHLPTGGAELHWPIGGRPRLLGPLTAPFVETLAPGSVVLGVRFHPGAVRTSASWPELVDRHVTLDDLGHRGDGRLGEQLEAAPTPAAALLLLQHALLRRLSDTPGDRLVSHVVRRLMPWSTTDVATLATEVGLSTSQLRRRCAQTVGTGPKVLQRTLRFQGFLALAQLRATQPGAGGDRGTAALAAELGYADQAHLSREVRRLTGLSPTALLGGELGRCRCGHEHAASYAPFLVGRPAPDAVAGMRDPFKTRAADRS